MSLTAATYRDCLHIKRIHNDKYLERYYRKQLEKYSCSGGKHNDQESSESASHDLSESCLSQDDIQMKENKLNFKNLHRRATILMLNKIKTDEKIAEAQNKWYIISILSPRRFYWDMIVILFSIINAIILPLQFAFFNATQTENEVVIQVLDRLTLSVFVIDMIANIFTSYVDLQSSEEVTDLKLVVKNYFFSELFVIDFLSTFPMRQVADYIESESFSMFLIFLGLLKMQRLRRIEKLISHLPFSNETKALLKIIKMVFFLCLYLHIVACLWRFVIGKHFIWC